MESGGQAGGETGGCPHRLRRFRTRFKPLSGGVWLFVPARGHGGRAAGRARQGCVCGAGYPVRPFEQRNAPARSGGSDGPPARPSGSRAGSRAGSPPARLARRPAEPVNRRSSVGGPTREAARPTVRETRISGPLRAFLPAAARGRAFPGRGPGEDMEAFASKRASDPSGGPFPALCAAAGPLPRRGGPLLPHSGANTARQTGKRRPEGAGGCEAAPAGCCPPGKNGQANRIIPKPAQALPAQIPPESRSDRGKTPPSLHPGNAPAGRTTHPVSGQKPPQPGRGAALHRRLNAGQTRAISSQKASRRSLSAHIRVAAQLLGVV